jgi:hypothetical protein
MDRQRTSKNARHWPQKAGCTRWSHDAAKLPLVQDERFPPAAYGQARRTRTVGHNLPFNDQRNMPLERLEY